MGGTGAADRGVPPAAQDGASRPAPHHRGDHLARRSSGEAIIWRGDHLARRSSGEAIIWRHDSGAKWRQIPAALGPWWMAAQTFSRWSRLGAWERLLELAQQRGGVEAGMAFLDGTGIRAHHKAAGAAKKGEPQQSATCARRSVGRAVVMRARRA